jgi:hypothetical protein
VIIQNGYIQPIESVAGGQDPVTGYYNKPSTSYGEKIACQYHPNSHNDKGMVNGEHFTIATYTVLVEGFTFTASRARLLTLDDKEVGEYSVLSPEPLQAVGQTKIIL